MNGVPGKSVPGELSRTGMEGARTAKGEGVYGGDAHPAVATPRTADVTCLGDVPLHDSARPSLPVKILHGRYGRELGRHCVPTLCR